MVTSLTGAVTSFAYYGGRKNNTVGRENILSDIYHDIIINNTAIGDIIWEAARTNYKIHT